MSWEFVRGGWITWPSMENDREYRAQAGARAASFPGRPACTGVQIIVMVIWSGRMTWGGAGPAW